MVSGEARSESAHTVERSVDLDRAGRLLLFTLLGLFALYLLAALLSYPFGRDQGTFSVVGRTILEGGMPYKDAWDHKTPGIFFAFALAQLLFGESMLSIRLLEAIGLLLAGGSILHFSRRRLGSTEAGVFGACGAWYYYVQMDFWHTAQAESFASVCLVLSLVVVDRILEDPRRRAGAWLGMGVLVAVTGLLKPHLAFAFAAPLIFVVWHMRGDARLVRTLALAAGWLALGVLGVLAPVALWFLANGAWDDLLRTVVGYNSGHVALSWHMFTFWDVLGRGLWNLARFVTPFGWIGLALCVFRNRDRSQLEAMGLVAATIALLFMGVVLQGKLIKYHYGAIFPLYGLLIGWGWWRFWQQDGGSWPRSVAVLLAFALVPSTWGASAHFAGRNGIRLRAALDQERSLEYLSALYRHDDFHLGENLLVADWIRAHTREDESVFIWGFEPLIYFLSERPLASRYLFNVPMRAEWSMETYRRSLMEELEHSRPSVFVVMAGDVFPWVSGNERDSVGELLRFEALHEYLDESYAPAERIGDFAIYLRRPELRKAAAPAPREDGASG